MHTFQLEHEAFSLPQLEHEAFSLQPHYCMAAFLHSPELYDYIAIKLHITLEGWGARWDRSRLAFCGD